MTTHGLGRRVAPDPQDHRYLMRVAPQPAALPPYRHYRSGRILDQGSTPTCVGMAWRQWMSSAPLMTRTGPDPFALYREAQLIDEWPGEAYDGTSVRAGAKVLQQRGHIRSYVWSFTADDVFDFMLAGHGGVVIGVNWYTGMMTADTSGCIRPVGRVLGGHAVFLGGVNRTRGVVRVLNSWSTAWADKGRAWLTGEDLDRLLKEDGEACCGLEQVVAP